MVKNNSHSLRGSVSNLSLRTSASITAQEAAARQRIAELEAQVASLSAQAAASACTTDSSSIETVLPQQDKNSDFQSRARPYSTEEEDRYDHNAGQQESRSERLTLANVRELLRMREQKMAAEQSRLRSIPEPRAIQEEKSSVSSQGYAQTTPFLPFPPRPWFAAPEECELPEGTTLFEKFNEDMGRRLPRRSLITKGLAWEAAEEFRLKSPEAYTRPFCDFLTENPTIWHTVNYFEKRLERAGFVKLSERKSWAGTLKSGGKYYISRNGSSLIAFTVGSGYKSGNGVAMVAGHIDALTARLKPIGSKKTTAGYVQLGIAPYAGALNSTWWDRDLGIGGRVIVKDGTTGKITTKLVKLDWPIARIPTLAPHFGVGMTGSENKETQSVPIIGLDNSDIKSGSENEFKNLTLGGADSFAATQPPKLVHAIAGELSINDYSSIVNWELELFDTQPAQTGGLDKEFIFGGRIDDKLCSWAAMEGLLASSSSASQNPSFIGGGDEDGIIKLAAVFDDEEIGSLLRQGARGNFLPSTIERIVESLSSSSSSSANLISQTYANSFLVSADVTHALNPNFLSSYLENHAPRLNVGLVVCADSNGHMTTDSVSTALLTRVAEKSGSELQVFMIRNDSRSGGTVGPMLSSAMGVRAIDAGIPQLSMHSIRATTGALDPGLGVKIFKGFFDTFESVDREFE